MPTKSDLRIWDDFGLIVPLFEVGIGELDKRRTAGAHPFTASWVIISAEEG